MKRWMPLLTVVLVLTLVGLASACPMCKDSIPNSDAQEMGSLPGGFNSSVYLMLGGFFAVLGLVGFNLWRGTKQ
jgi:hypothetical protein